jgi:hypothetical protein
MTKILLFLVGCALVLTAFALTWPWIAPGYAAVQIFLVRPLVAADLRLSVEGDGIAIYRAGGEQSLVRRDFLSFGGVGLTLALWLLTPGLAWRRRLLWGATGLSFLFCFHVLVLWGLVVFVQAVESGHAGGLYTLLYGFIAVSDWVVPVVLWGIVLMGYRFSGSGAIP